MSNKEYIEREKYVKLNDIIETLEHEWGYEGMREDLYNLPAADVVEVKHGEWIKKSTCVYKCSLCVGLAFMDFNGEPCRYCPSCGAKMSKKEGV
jgi:rubrerythrin